MQEPSVTNTLKKHIALIIGEHARYKGMEFELKDSEEDFRKGDIDCDFEDRNKNEL